MVRDIAFDEEEYDRLQEAMDDDIDDIHLRAPSHDRKKYH